VVGTGIAVTTLTNQRIGDLQSTVATLDSRIAIQSSPFHNMQNIELDPEMLQKFGGVLTFTPTLAINPPSAIQPMSPPSEILDEDKQPPLQ